LGVLEPLRKGIYKSERSGALFEVIGQLRASGILFKDPF